MKKKMGKMDQYKVTKQPVYDFVEKQLEDSRRKFEELLARPLRSEREVYDNICQLESMLSYPHDHIPDARNRVNEKLYYIQEALGKEILDQGMMIYEHHQSNCSLCKTMSLGDRIRIEEEIIKDPALAAQMDDIRYHPEKYQKLTGKYNDYLAVYCQMVEREMENREEEKQKEEKELD